MDTNFESALEFVLRHECAYEEGHQGDLMHVICEDVSGDAGGCTKYGIDAADHPGVDIAGLTLDQAVEIYRAGEWTECRCDALPVGLDAAVFDCAVNNGVHVSGTLLQRALNACGAALTVDGVIGQETIAASQRVCGLTYWGLVTLLLELRREHYGDIVRANPADGEFLHGWLNRVNDLEEFLEEERSYSTRQASTNRRNA